MFLDKAADIAVVGPKIVALLRHTMGLVRNRPIANIGADGGALSPINEHASVPSRRGLFTAYRDDALSRGAIC